MPRQCRTLVIEVFFEVRSPNYRGSIRVGTQLVRLGSDGCSCPEVCTLALWLIVGVAYPISDTALTASSLFAYGDVSELFDWYPGIPLRTVHRDRSGRTETHPYCAHRTSFFVSSPSRYTTELS